MKFAFVHNPGVGEFSYGEVHPFVAARAGMTLDLCRSRDLMDSPAEHVIPEMALRRELELFHDPAYLDVLREASSGGPVSEAWVKHGLGTADCPVFEGVWEYSLMVAGGSLHAARLVADRTFDRAFHPAGGLHHASPDRASGFCYVNDVVLAVMELRRRGLRVAVVDIDAHHGDGTQAAFYSDPDVLTISVHESGKSLFPGTGGQTELGEGKGRGLALNVPLPVDTYDEMFLSVIRRIVMPALERFGPDVLVTEVGADTLSSDPLTNLSLTNNGIVDAVQILDGLNLPWVVTGGGGYNVGVTVKAWTLVWSVVRRKPLEDPYLGLIGGMMTGLSDVEGGDLRDRQHYIPPEQIERVQSELEPIVEFLEKQIERL